MTLILNTAESKWLSDFYSEPQGLSWKILASDNASELSQNLNVEYNKSRQAAITNQIIEVTSGAQAMN